MRRVVVSLVVVLLATTVYGNSEKAPDFPHDLVWIDTGTNTTIPHSIDGYHGHILLIDFWEYTCINCIRDFSIVKRWYAKYHPYGFDVVGVHYGEFDIAFKIKNVEQAARRFHLPWPVAADIKGSMWREYHSEVWPNRYLVGPNGNIVMHVEGETGNHAMETRIRELLAAAHPEVNKIPLDPAENTFSPQCGVCTEETYVGNWFGRGALENPGAYHNGTSRLFRALGPPQDGGVMLDGDWLTEHDGVISAARNSTAQLRYHARSVYSVMSVHNQKKPVRVYLLQDGKPIAHDAAGQDVQFDAQGSYVEVSEPRMYYLLKNLVFGSHLLTLKPQGSGFDLHSFTYGNNCQQNFTPM